jgi:hypothetical protein
MNDVNNIRPTEDHPIIKLANEIMQRNHEYLHDNAIDVYREIIQLINDVIDYSGNYLRLVNLYNEYPKTAKLYFLFNILSPYSSAIYMDILIGNMPACFVELRMILESLAESYLADLKYPNEQTFQSKLDKLRDEKIKDKYGNIREISITQRMKELGTSIKVDDIPKLYGKLSLRWVHSKGVMNRIGNGMSNYSVPSWGVSIPGYYSEADLSDLGKMSQYTNQIRMIIGVALKEYK